MKHSIEDIKRLLAEADGDGIPVFNPHAIIRDLLAEVERLDAENLELNAGLAEFNVIHQALKDSEAQLQAAESKIKWWEEHHNSEMDETCAELTEAENLAASRLADQESIERRVAVGV